MSNPWRPPIGKWRAQGKTARCTVLSVSVARVKVEVEPAVPDEREVVAATLMPMSALNRENRLSRNIGIRFTPVRSCALTYRFVVSLELTRLADAFGLCAGRCHRARRCRASAHERLSPPFGKSAGCALDLPTPPQGLSACVPVRQAEQAGGSDWETGAGFT